jgi:glycosyltransferase involved in cell wall biosynthesis
MINPDVNSDKPSRQCRICHVIDHLSLHGAQVYLAKLVRGLSEKGYKQRIYGLNDPRSPEIDEMLSSAGAKVETIGKVKLISLYGLVKLFLDLRAWRPHVLQTFLPFSDVIGRSLGRFSRVPVIVSVVTQPNVEKWGWQYAVDRVTAPWADRVVFNSRAIVPFALSREGVKPEQVEYIPNGIELDSPSRPDAGQAMRQRLDIRVDAKVVGCVARLYPQKGHMHLLDAFSEVVKQVRTAVLLVVGDGPLRLDLERRAAERGIAGATKFLGNRPDLRDLLECMDLYVQSSLWEGMSIALMQAMLRGLPVVATKVDGTLEIVENGRTGFLVQPGDSHGLAQSILNALSNRDETHRVAERGASLIRREFSVRKMVDSFDDLYHRLMKDSGKPCARI